MLQILHNRIINDSRRWLLVSHTSEATAVGESNVLLLCRGRKKVWRGRAKWKRMEKGRVLWSRLDFLIFPLMCGWLCCVDALLQRERVYSFFKEAFWHKLAITVGNNFAAPILLLHHIWNDELRSSFQLIELFWVIQHKYFPICHHGLICPRIPLRYSLPFLRSTTTSHFYLTVRLRPTKPTNMQITEHVPPANRLEMKFLVCNCRFPNGVRFPITVLKYLNTQQK